MANESILMSFSNQLADIVSAASPSVVQVHGRGRPASGIVYAQDMVLTTAQALGRENGIRVRHEHGEPRDAEVAGWDPATGLVLLRTTNLTVAPARLASAPARVGHLVIAIARSWSNAVTASSGMVSVIGGPLATGRRRAIEEVIRTTAPMHDGFAGGALLDVGGGLLGVATAARIRGLGVVIPAAIAWKTAAALVQHGTMKRGYLGIAGQPARLAAAQQAVVGRSGALLVVAVTDGSPAAGAGITVGDVIVALDEQPVESPEDLLELLAGDRVGRSVSLRILRGGQLTDVAITIGERPAS